MRHKTFKDAKLNKNLTSNKIATNVITKKKNNTIYTNYDSRTAPSVIFHPDLELDISYLVV